MHRLNSVYEGEAEPRVSPAFSKGGPGYAGLYQYMSTNVMRGTGGEVRGRKVETTNYERWATSRGQGQQSSSSRSSGFPEESQVVSVTPAECKEIQRCFEE
jgi:hypothetical protein